MATTTTTSFTFKPIQQTQLQLSSFTHCKYSVTLNPFKFHCSFHTLFSPPTKYTLEPPRISISPSFHLETRLSFESEQENSDPRKHSRSNSENGSGVSFFSLKDKGLGNKSSRDNLGSVAEENGGKRIILKDRNAKSRLSPNRSRELGSELSSIRSKNENLEKWGANSKGRKLTDRNVERKDRKDGGIPPKMEKGSKKSKIHSPGATLRIGLDMCSKRGDILGAIRLYELAVQEGIAMGQYHYAVLLYLCASAASGVVQPAKSGSGSRSSNLGDLANETFSSSSENQDEFGEIGNEIFDASDVKIRASKNGSRVETSIEQELNLNGFPGKVTEHDSDSELYQETNMSTLLSSTSESYPQNLDELVQLMKSRAKVSDMKNARAEQEAHGIQVSEDMKHHALVKGFEIYEKMRTEKVQMNEATFTSVARMAMVLGNGDMAFNVIKQMKEYGINPRLRSYGPALSVFCNNRDVERAFLVEKHMLEHGVVPEEPELEALLKVSVEAGRSDMVYYLLHKLRTGVRQVSPSTADLIEKWFKSKVASRVGKRKWDEKSILKAIENGGGGWHGQGWLGNGKWTVLRGSIDSDGFCKCCGEKLVTIDLDPEETENFAKSVASIAAERERNSSFQKFQRWLDYYGPFEAVIDGANIGLYSQRRFKPSKVNVVVNGIRQMLPSKKWPLIVLHNRRITGDKMDEPFNKALIEKWKNADAIYATPTGSNDDWYWLYAAIKFRCLIVTNDEMRDHLFQLLGNDFFQRWKERHQVHFSFSEAGPIFHMPPPCSVVIQESEKGHWHVPIVSELESERERTWLCIRRANSTKAKQESASVDNDNNVGDPCPPKSHSPHPKRDAKSRSRREKQTKVTARTHVSPDGNKEAPEEIYRSLKNILQLSISTDHRSILPELEAAEELGCCIVDFQI